MIGDKLLSVELKSMLELLEGSLEESCQFLRTCKNDKNVVLLVELVVTVVEVVSS